MSSRLSRRTLATHVAQRLVEGDGSVIEELAALLIDDGRVREADILARDIENQLAILGEVVVTVESAQPIDDSVRARISKMFEGKTVHIREIVRKELIGGVKISTPTRMLNETVAAKLAALKAMKV